ncbi:MAG TPA: DUF427 domain-containing protein, partial [Acidimicrobiales bacterium]|nr:DUF427 domain-containing protein [Acidimicrobiales bacterium]
RGEVASVVVVDTVEVRMLHETALLPRWYLPREAVRGDLLEPSATTSHCPFKGDACYWHLRVADRLIEDAFWEYPEPRTGAPDLSGLLSPYLEKFDRWLEEDEEVVGHPRDPFHRVDALRSSRTVTVRAGDQVLARSDRPLAVNETGLPTRWYVPRQDVLVDLERSDTTTTCPYKGRATYWHVRGGTRIDDGAWSYEEPLSPAGALAGAVSFLGEEITVDVDADGDGARG